MNMVAEQPGKIWSEAELQALPENGYRHEVVDGKLTVSPKNDFFHGEICTRLSAALLAFARQHKLGAVLDSSTGFWMENRNCRAPDISFVHRDRLKAMGFKRSSRTFFPGAPDLAVEILSRNSTRMEIDARLKDFFASGARLVWVIEPESRFVEVCHSLTDRKLVAIGGFLDGEDLLPGFQYPIAELFSEWDWD
jgi:Uma2 family endonuclease